MKKQAIKSYIQSDEIQSLIREEVKNNVAKFMEDSTKMQDEIKTLQLAVYELFRLRTHLSSSEQAILENLKKQYPKLGFLIPMLGNTRQ